MAKLYSSRLYLACDAELEKLKFPCIIFPKIDGVRGGNTSGVLMGRRGRAHNNVFTTQLFSGIGTLGFDGELAANSANHPDLCRLTSGALNSKAGNPTIMWHVFDDMSPEVRDLPYSTRLCSVIARINALHQSNPVYAKTIGVAYFEFANNLEQLLAAEKKWLDQGYEGVIIRSLEGAYKQGRCTVNEGDYLRLKRFQESEATVVEIIEEMTNNNPLERDGIGLAKRSGASANLIPAGRVGSLICKDLVTGQIFKIGIGKMTESEAEKYFKNPDLLLNQVVKYKHFPKGVKDKPRLPTFQCIRIASDIG